MARRGALGRGLDSLLVDSAAPKTSEERPQELPISQIKPNAGQPRKNFDKEALEELAASIKANGVLQPILVRPAGDGYEIVAGERRYQASKLAGLKQVPAVVREVSDEDVFQLALIENLQRADLDPLEEAEGYRKLIQENGFTQEQLGKILSKSRSAIANALRLLELPEQVQTLIQNSEISAGHARAVLMVEGDEARERFAKKIASDKLSVRQAESLAALYSADGKPAKKKGLTPDSFKRAARSLRKSLETRVKVRQVRGRNKIEIEFDDESELERIVDVITSNG